MNWYKIVSLSLTLGVFLSSQAETLHPHPKPARSRIMHGVRKGSLTHKEMKWLLWEQKQIRQLHQWAKKNNGRMGPGERKILRRQKAKANRRIFRMNHNRCTHHWFKKRTT